MAEWLGSALQKLLHQFESGRDLDKCKMRLPKGRRFCFLQVRNKLCLFKHEEENKNSVRQDDTFCIMTLGFPIQINGVNLVGTSINEQNHPKGWFFVFQE